jgi:ferrous iron transport protein B
MALVLNVLNTVGVDGNIGNKDSDSSVLAVIGRSITPVFAPMGLQEDNWPATVGIFTGILAKEAVVGTLDAAYTALAASEEGESVDQPSFDLTGSLREAFATIPANLGDALGIWIDSPERDVGDIGDQTARAEERALFTAGAPSASWPAVSKALLVRLLTCFSSCSICPLCWSHRRRVSRSRSQLDRVCRLLDYRSRLWYGVSTLYYQSATWWSQHPTTSFAWIAGILLAFGAVLIAMRWVGHSAPHPGLQRNSVGGKVS